MRRILTESSRMARQLWRGLRDWCGDSAYERYASSIRRNGDPKSVLSREAFYVDQLNRRYSRPNRCC